jgi:integrase
MGKKFTDKYVDGLKPKNVRFEVWDSTGLGLRVTPKGTKSWISLYKLNGVKNRRITHGQYPNTSLSEARTKHLDTMDEVKLGLDPANKMVKQRIQDRQAVTVREFVDIYIEDYAKDNKVSWAEDQRMLLKDVVPLIGDMKLKDVEKREINQILKHVRLRKSVPNKNGKLGTERKTAVNRIFSVVRKMFNWAVESDVIKSAPCAGIKTPFKETRRDRVLSEKEIRIFWEGVGNARLEPCTKLILKLLLVTAQRVGEITSMRWSNVDLNEGFWTIPSAIAKNRNEHLVPLSPLAVSLLLEAQSLPNDGDWIFPSPRGNNHYSVMAIGQAIRKNRDSMPIDHFTPHDLRRTAASHIAGLRIAPHVISKILNHTDRSVTAIYNRYMYSDEKQEALEKWGIKLNEILAE